MSIEVLLAVSTLSHLVDFGSRILAQQSLSLSQAQETVSIAIDWIIIEPLALVVTLWQGTLELILDVAYILERTILVLGIDILQATSLTGIAITIKLLPHILVERYTHYTVHITHGRLSQRSTISLIVVLEEHRTHHQSQAEGIIPHSLLILAVINSVDNLLVLLVVKGKYLGKVVLQSYVSLLHVLISSLGNLIISVTAAHLLTAPEISLTLEHLGSSQRPVVSAVGKLVVLAVSLLRSLDILLDLSHYLSCWRSSLTHVADVDVATLGIVGHYDDIAIGSQQLEVYEGTHTVC